jgi:hypothetical protein
MLLHKRKEKKREREGEKERERLLHLTERLSKEE